MPSLDRQAARLAGEIDRMQWRMSRMRRPAIVEEYDHEKHLVRLRLTTAAGTGGLTGWCRVNEASGDHTSRTTLKKGQTCWADCPNGDIRQATCTPGNFSDTFKSPSQHEDETMIARGENANIAVRDGEIEIKAGGSSIVLNGDGVKVVGAMIDLNP